MSVEIASPCRRPPFRFGILETWGSKPLDPRTLSGQDITYVQESCRGTDSFNPIVCPIIQDLKPVPEHAIRGLADDVGFPFGVFVALDCSTVGNSIELNTRRTRDRLKAQLPLRLSLEFYNQLNADPQLVDFPGPYTPECALHFLEAEHANATGLGRSPVIYGDTAVISALTRENLVIVVGPNDNSPNTHLETKLGSLVVNLPHDAPYTPLYLFGSDSCLDIYLSDIQIVSDEQLTDVRSENTYITYAELEALLVADHCHLSRFTVSLCS